MLQIKYLPTEEEIKRIDTIKRNLTKLSWKGSVGKTIGIFVEENWHLLSPTLPQSTESAIEIANIVNDFTTNLGIRNLGFVTIIEKIMCDMAYRLRIQDIAISANRVRLYKKPITEIKRLWKLYLTRETIIPTYMIPKVRRYFYLMVLLLLVPKVRKAWKKTVQNIEWKNLQFTEDDLEWIKVRQDYKFFIWTTH